MSSFCKSLGLLHGILFDAVYFGVSVLLYTGWCVYPAAGVTLVPLTLLRVLKYHMKIAEM